VAGNRGDHRLPQQHPRRPHRTVAGEGVRSRAAGLCRDLEVEAGAERAAGAVKDGDFGVLVAVERGEGIGESLRHRRVDGVARRFAVDDDRRDRSVLLHPDRHRTPRRAQPTGIIQP
jgi:hypothetical protein